MMEIEIIKGDITKLDVDAIVNAANKYLQEGGGVCGAIFRAANSPRLQEECNKYSPIKTGDAIITRGYNLKAKYIIHAVGPVYRDDSSSIYLEKAYYNSLELADDYNLKTIAFPSISTGIYGYPLEKASKIAIDTIKKYDSKSINKVILVCFNDEAYNLYIKYYNLTFND